MVRLQDAPRGHFVPPPPGEEPIDEPDTDYPITDSSDAVASDDSVKDPDYINDPSVPGPSGLTRVTLYYDSSDTEAESGESETAPSPKRPRQDPEESQERQITAPEAPAAEAPAAGPQGPGQGRPSAEEAERWVPPAGWSRHDKLWCASAARLQLRRLARRHSQMCETCPLVVCDKNKEVETWAAPNAESEAKCAGCGAIIKSEKKTPPPHLSAHAHGEGQTSRRG